MTTKVYPMPPSPAVAAAALEITTEYYRARSILKHPPMHSAHEGYAIIKEELDELWESIRCDVRHTYHTEAVQAAAMLLAFILEVAP